MKSIVGALKQAQIQVRKCRSWVEKLPDGVDVQAFLGECNDLDVALTAAIKKEE